MYRLTIRLIVLAALVISAGAAPAKVIPTDPADLNASEEQLHATELILEFLRRYHYRNRTLDDEHSELIFERYLEALDPNRSYFLQSDIEAFEKYKHRLDDALRDAKLRAAFEIFITLRQRLEERAGTS